MSSLASRLLQAMPDGETLAIAVSGGLDSLTLAHFVARVASRRVEAYHAVSPAVPEAATRRVRQHAADWGWSLHVLDAGEFADPDYLANPVNRCFYCKQNLYRSIRSLWPGTLFSGTNTDDLRDFRPGLKSAAEWNVTHPYVLAALAKTDVRALARQLELPDIEALPAQPCLASRVETGIAIDGGDLRMVDGIETLVREQLGEIPVRCRVRRRGITLELDQPVLEALPPERLTRLAEDVAGLCVRWQRPFAGIEPYRMGSAFLGTGHEN